MSLDVLEGEALAFANRLRAVHGHAAVDALEPGVPHSCCGCPVAATAGGWTPGSYGWEVGKLGAVYVGPQGGIRKTVPVPAPVLDFMAAFDAGEYQSLVLAAEWTA